VLQAFLLWKQDAAAKQATDSAERREVSAAEQPQGSRPVVTFGSGGLFPCAHQV